MTMTRYFYDTEFLEDGSTIELISIGIVCEDGRDYYAVSKDAPWKRIYKHEWLCKNVVPSLPRIHGDRRLQVGRSNPYALDFDDRSFKSRSRIATDILDFIKPHPLADVELWAWYGAYDHVALCQLWGRMIDLPEGMPMFTHDIKQEAHRLGDPELPEQASGVHNALADARHNKVMFDALRQLQRETA